VGGGGLGFVRGFVCVEDQKTRESERLCVNPSIVNPSVRDILFF
jgi:hypothetical protein